MAFRLHLSTAQPLADLVRSCLAEKPVDRPTASVLLNKLRERLEQAPRDKNDERASAAGPCKVCREQPSSVVIQCGHVVLCETCAVMLLGEKKQAECPACRKVFVNYKPKP